MYTQVYFSNQFACFERTLEALYSYVVTTPRDQLSVGQQMAVTFAAGYFAGVFCAVISHPSDTIVSKLNKDRGSSVVDVIRSLELAGLLLMDVFSLYFCTVREQSIFH
jgi:solute carrier family 25 phosphate transporter 3